MRVREAVRRRLNREEWVAELSQEASSEDVERVAALLEAQEEEQDAIRAFRDSLLPPP